MSLAEFVRHPRVAYAALCTRADATARRAAYKQLVLDVEQAVRDRRRDGVVQGALAPMMTAPSELGRTLQAITIAPRGGCRVVRGARALQEAMRTARKRRATGFGLLLCVDGEPPHQNAAWVDTLHHRVTVNERDALRGTAAHDMYAPAEYEACLRALFHGFSVVTPRQWQHPVEGQSVSNNGMCFLWCCAWLHECAALHGDCRTARHRVMAGFLDKQQQQQHHPSAREHDLGWGRAARRRRPRAAGPRLEVAAGV